ncbi:PREDICTED: UBX [Prunus dulcis]|uniref:PREDICTED: UBX n=1 Tax=Prunus dulcis TaxID=3755 RepID=A0A5E4GEM9_PRUDU|nr:plant UBX domain-containing protein 11 isoform X1 [Prunus dulcis]VVA38214.1 PREDICTED: UBX [Prunus dulcis]
MEPSLTSLTYKGSIPEAITEAKKQRKLFVVYISGKNDESSRLENSTWTDVNVADSAAKYCILLHIPEESTDAANFSAIYPQKSIPCITAIGYNGVQIWQNEGFVSAEVLASSLEKAWLGIHIQETTATVLSAALASNNSEPSTSGVPNTVSTDEGSSSSTNQGCSPSAAVPSPSIDTNDQSPDAIDAVSDTVKKNKGCDCRVEEKNNDLGYKTSSKSFDANGLECVGDEQSSSPMKSAQGVQDIDMEDLNNSGADNVSSIAEVGYSGPEKTTLNHSGVSGEASQAYSSEKNEALQVQRGEVKDDKKVDAFEKCTEVSKSSDVHLNIRLPNGVSLKQKFSVTSTVRMVKDYVDENQGSGIGTYDLAIPYPRKVFSNQELNESLSDLGLFDRQALIVVPHQQGTSYQRGRSAFSDQIDSRNTGSSSNGSNGGYFSYVKGFLSYFNPLSYFGGGANSSSSGQQSQNGMWEYSPNSARQNNSTESISTSSRNEGKKKRQPPASGFGSNIHTLKHDEDDERFSDRNAFWNGNSTQYGGGNDDGK